MSTFNDKLRWRYATKKFDPTKKLSDDQFASLLEAAQLSASSYGLQPYRIVVIGDPVVRAKVREHAWGQAQITDASHIVAICPMRTIDEAYVTRYIDLIASTRGIPAANLKGFHDMMMGAVNGRTPEALAAWMKCQAYIAVGFLLSAAAEQGIDACPMEGFDPVHVDVDLDLAKENLTSAVLVALGFRAADDEAAAYKKVRMPKETLFLQR
jgi:nitroreductase